MFVIFNKTIANKLIKRGFILREIGGNKQEVYYFTDSTALREAIESITKELDSQYEQNRL